MSPHTTREIPHWDAGYLFMIRWLRSLPWLSRSGGQHRQRRRLVPAGLMAGALGAGVLLVALTGELVTLTGEQARSHPAPSVSGSPAGRPTTVTATPPHGLGAAGGVVRPRPTPRAPSPPPTTAAPPPNVGIPCASGNSQQWWFCPGR